MGKKVKAVISELQADVAHLVPSAEDDGISSMAMDAADRAVRYANPGGSTGEAEKNPTADAVAGCDVPNPALGRASFSGYHLAPGETVLWPDKMTIPSFDAWSNAFTDLPVGQLSTRDHFLLQAMRMMPWDPHNSHFDVNYAKRAAQITDAMMKVRNG